VTVATANPIGLVVGGAIKASGEISGRDTIEGAAERTASQIATELKAGFAKQGWIDLMRRGTILTLVVLLLVAPATARAGSYKGLRARRIEAPTRRTVASDAVAAPRMTVHGRVSGGRLRGFRPSSARGRCDWDTSAGKTAAVVPMQRHGFRRTAAEEGNDASRFIVGTLLLWFLVAACAGASGAGTERGGRRVRRVRLLTADYSRLAPVKPGSADAPTKPEHVVLELRQLYINRITVWRDQDQTEPSKRRLPKVVDALHAVATREIGKSFTLVDKLRPRVGRLRIALVAIDHPDDRLDVYVSRGDALLAESDAPMPTDCAASSAQRGWKPILDGATNEPFSRSWIAWPTSFRAPNRSRPGSTFQLAFDAWAKPAGRLAELKTGADRLRAPRPPGLPRHPDSIEVRRAARWRQQQILIEW
jgi:hypothetical protein